MLKKQYAQSLLAYEQTERLYLLEKSKLQPSFTLSVTEFLLCEPDFMNDPEQASEAQFLTGQGMKSEERVVRFHFSVKGGADYLRPSLVLGLKGDQKFDDCAFAMNELLYFAPVDRLKFVKDSDSFVVYFVYRDKTSLPIVLKYRISKREGSSLLRWETDHLDTIYGMTHHRLSLLKQFTGCEALFADRE